MQNRATYSTESLKAKTQPSCKMPHILLSCASYIKIPFQVATNVP